MSRKKTPRITFTPSLAGQVNRMHTN